MGNAAEYFMFFKWKSKILVCLCFFYSKKIFVKSKGTFLFTNHFDVGWKENSLIKIDWDPVEPPGGLLGLIFAGYVPLAS